MTERQYVICKINEEEYGIGIEYVKEIGEYQNPTRLPDAPNFVEGIINVRGVITPLIVLRKKFNKQNKELGKSCRIIIIYFKGKQLGLIVDDASQVLRINEEDVMPPPHVVEGMEKQYVSGIATLKERMIILLDLKGILSMSKDNTQTQSA
ncbi:chemotaxis protein CheW [Alkaliphilus serpentinus]|uniref:Purine-binding chemotaxis protein CheW n=1 Tax=Alkaliphilus serpentinus TaxID=1482731 RepID=A0A833M8J5_9FIRM|nr:chemotaxis protein CheW [Alkaliphilus serpentinus]KAB3525933.1 purine-binding chemotaxis protein CheW [Alkaliphilus serpentinus]